MLRVTLALMRRSVGRLAAAGLAIVIGTAFVAASLLAGAVITRTSYDAVASEYADADLVVTTAGDQPLTVADLAELRATPGVASIYGKVWQSYELVAGAKRVVAPVNGRAASPRLEAQKLISGRFPAGPGEIALPGPVADRLDLAIGGTLSINVSTGEHLTVVGLLSDPAGAFAQAGGAAVIRAQDAERWATESAGMPPTYTQVVVALADRDDTAAAIGRLEAVAPHGTMIRTKDAEAEAITREVTGGTEVYLRIVLGFAAIALFVAALVISNTFQVLIAQRTRTLALLRCVGADKGQLRKSVLLEAGLLGVAASGTGLLLGVGLGQAALTVLRHQALDVPLPATVSVTATVVLAPLLVGTLVTLLAALAPARAATRVAPLAALRPADAPAFSRRRNLPRVVLATLLTVGGVALLLFAAVGPSLGEVIALGIGVLGGAASFAGVLVGAVFWVPAVVGAAGRLFASTGTAAKLAAANTVRNPRRTAATSTALLIGVTLVAMMSTGAASARATLGSALDDQYPVDVTIVPGAEIFGGPSATGGAADLALAPALIRTVEDVPGVEHVVVGRNVEVQLDAAGTQNFASAMVIGTDEATVAVRASSMVRGLGDETIVISRPLAVQSGIADGDPVAVTGNPIEAGPHAPTPTTLTASVTNLPNGVMITPAAFERMSIDLPDNRVWVRLTDVNEAGTVVPAIQDALSDTGVQVTGAGVERAHYQRIIDTLLAIVVGLLAVAVVIALIGVANTLALSVIERRRESATLRALGLSRRQLRATLAIEGMLIAGVGAVLGILLGTLYGWAGAATLLGTIGEVRLEVPWGDLGLVVLIAILAGLLASVLPGRSAARTSPVAALAVE